MNWRIYLVCMLHALLVHGSMFSDFVNLLILARHRTSTLNHTWRWLHIFRHFLPFICLDVVTPLTFRFSTASHLKTVVMADRTRISVVFAYFSRYIAESASIGIAVFRSHFRCIWADFRVFASLFLELAKSVRSHVTLIISTTVRIPAVLLRVAICDGDALVADRRPGVGLIDDEREHE